MEAEEFSKPCSLNGCKDLNVDITFGEQIIASSVGALATSIIVTPMDVVKIRLQQQVRPVLQGECFLYSNGLMDHLCTNCEDPRKPLSKCEWFNRPGNFNGTIVSTYDAFAKIMRYEGISSLWSGLSPTMLSAIPATVFYFTIYDNILRTLRERMGDKIYVPLLSGTIARAIAVTVVSPLELIRTKMQSYKHSNEELKKAVLRTVLNNGYRSLWRGLSATLLRDIPFSAIYWTCYEYFKNKAIEKTKNQKTTFEISFLCGASAGIIAALFTMPFDVVKTQQQITLGKKINNFNTQSESNKLKTVLYQMRSIVKSNGPSSLFAGVIPRIARVAPACAIMIGSYEYLKIFFSERRLLHPIN